MKQVPFVGRQRELEDLKLLLKKRTPSLVVVQGRRRIGKSRLIQHFGKDRNFYRFSGYPPTESTTAQSQRNEFSRQLSEQTSVPDVKPDDWSILFALLAQSVNPKKPIVLFDEISWIGSKDPDFLGKLKNAWDMYFKEIPGIILILCGSVSTWIENNILSSTGFFGRFSLILKLEELPLKDCSLLLDKLGFKGSAYDKFKLLAVLGGVPHYLEEVQPGLTVEENIKRLFFRPQGILFKEFDTIFVDLFSKKSESYKKIVKSLSNGSAEYNDVCERLGVQKSGHISNYLDDLVKSGFISRDYTWHLKSGKESRLSLFRLSDNFLRFYLKYVDKNRHKIEKGHFEDNSLGHHPGWESVMGLQFENLVLNNRHYILEKLHLRKDDIICDNPYFQRKTTRYPGCQIDYLVQTKYNNIFACEIKFRKNEIKPEIIEEMKDKLARMHNPKGFSCWPVLIHVNGVHEAVEDSEYFASIIDFTDLFR